LAEIGQRERGIHQNSWIIAGDFEGSPCEIDTLQTVRHRLFAPAIEKQAETAMRGPGECPRIGAEFLEKMRQKLGPMLFAQEFEGEFIDAESSAFSSEMIELALVDDFERFVQ